MDNTTETEAAPAVDTQDAAPTLPATTAEQTPPTDKVEQKTDYSWVPPKFLKDGSPDFQNLAKSYVNLEKRIGMKGAVAPESIDEYEYTPSKLQFEPETSSAFKAEAQKAGLSKDQYKWVMTKYEEEMDRFLPSPEKTEAYLKETWGADFEKNSASMLRAYEAYVPSNVPIEAIGNNPYVLDILARIGAEMQEDTSPARGATAATAMSKDDIGKLMRDPNYYRDPKMQKQVSDWYAKNAK